MTEDTKQKMQGAIEHFKGELRSLRSNRANPAVLDSVQVDVYGTMLRLKELANVTTPEARQLLITPFDPQTAGAIAKGIEKAGLNLQPVVEGGAIRIQVPPMDEAMRKQIAKQADKMAEDRKVAIREIRRKANEQARKEKADGILTEDQMKRVEKETQTLTDEACKKIDLLCEEKKKEIITV